MNYWYEVFDMDEADNAKLNAMVRVNETRMIKYAKKHLKDNKSLGYDKNITQKDLSRPINAWVYLKNIGIGGKTNRKVW